MIDKLEKLEDNNKKNKVMINMIKEVMKESGVLEIEDIKAYERQ